MAAASGRAQQHRASVQSPQVNHTGATPTGYAVTFRYSNPKATSVRIKGEWSFERPSELPLRAATPEHPVVEGQGLPPAAWRPGDVPLQHPNSTGPNFPVDNMKRGSDGTWTITLPLPSGVFSYAFYVDCDGADLSKCSPIADPMNLPWTEREGITESSTARNSQVYVPSDSKFQTVDYGWQGPSAKKGKVVHVTYPSPGHIMPKDTNYLVIYTPPGYDAKRPKAYPTLYLSHGGGENELGWTTQGDAANILDNLIDTGQIEPLLVIMPNATGFPNSDYNEAYDRDLIDNMIPYVEQRYHVATTPAGRAFSGLSMGGMLTNSFLTKHPEVFDYYGVMSAGLRPQENVLTPAQIAGLKGKSVWLGGGWQDVIFAAGFNVTHIGPAREVSTFVKAGVPITADFIDGGHEWYVWRILLRDFLTHIAFHPPFYASWQ